MNVFYIFIEYIFMVLNEKLKSINDFFLSFYLKKKKKDKNKCPKKKFSK